jgi:predicted outer membrane protein
MARAMRTAAWSGSQSGDISSMRRLALGLVAALAIFGLARCAAPAHAAELHIQDQVFLLYATEIDRIQVRLGQLAAEKAQDEQVRQFARRMINYHQQSNARLIQIAQPYGIETRKGSARSLKGCRTSCKGCEDLGLIMST